METQSGAIMDKLEREIFKERMFHPNCMYCKFLNSSGFFYRCNKSNKRFLLNNISRAKKCSEYFPRTNDLKMAVRVKKELELYDSTRI